MDDWKRRLVTLETMLFWEGGFSVQRLSERLGVRREHLQRTLIPDYKSRHPRALQRKGRTYTEPPEGVVPLLIPEDPAELFNLLSAEDRVRDRCSNNKLGGAHTMDQRGIRTADVVTLTSSRPDTEKFRRLCMASAEKKCLVLSYMSRYGAIELKFSPHTLVRTAWRLHFRGHARGDQLQSGEMFIDLVPSRVLAVLSVGPGYVSDKGDVDWHARENLTFVLSDELPEEIRRQALQEFLSDEVTVPDVRRALGNYVRRAMKWRVFWDDVHLTWKEHEGSTT